MVNIKVCGHNVSIDNRYQMIDKISRQYRTDEPADVHIAVTDADMEDICSMDDEQYSDSYIETLAILKRLCDEFANDNIFLFHGVLLECDGRGYLFTAPSGTGKTTHTQLWLNYFGAGRVRIINGDKPFLKVNPDGTIIGYGTPWCGKECLNINDKTQVNGIVVLRQSPVNEIRRMERFAASQTLMRQSMIPERFDRRLKITACAAALGQLPVYELGCTISNEAVEMSYNALACGILPQ